MPILCFHPKSSSRGMFPLLEIGLNLVLDLSHLQLMIIDRNRIDEQYYKSLISSEIYYKWLISYVHDHYFLSCLTIIYLIIFLHGSNSQLNQTLSLSKVILTQIWRFQLLKFCFNYQHYVYIVMFGSWVKCFFT